jgi:hypothetical protein
MNIILGTAAADQARERYTVLELDTFRIQGHPDPVPAYCVIEHIPLEELALTQSMQTLHGDLMEHYRQRRWEYCQEAIQHLRGRWRGELDSFYDALSDRIQAYQAKEPDRDWDGAVLRGDLRPA